MNTPGCLNSPVLNVQGNLDTVKPWTSWTIWHQICCVVYKKNYQCLMQQRVKTPLCIHYRGVSTPWSPGFYKLIFVDSLVKTKTPRIFDKNSKSFQGMSNGTRGIVWWKKQRRKNLMTLSLSDRAIHWLLQGAENKICSSPSSVILSWKPLISLPWGGVRNYFSSLGQMMLKSNLQLQKV
jgi:hypothetical protein